MNAILGSVADLPDFSCPLIFGLLTHHDDVCLIIILIDNRGQSFLLQALLVEILYQGLALLTDCAVASVLLEIKDPTLVLKFRHCVVELF